MSLIVVPSAAARAPGTASTRPGGSLNVTAVAALDNRHRSADQTGPLRCIGRPDGATLRNWRDNDNAAFPHALPGARANLWAALRRSAFCASVRSRHLSYTYYLLSLKSSTQRERSSAITPIKAEVTFCVRGVERTELVLLHAEAVNVWAIWRIDRFLEPDRKIPIEVCLLRPVLADDVGPRHRMHPRQLARGRRRWLPIGMLCMA